MRHLLLPFSLILGVGLQTACSIGMVSQPAAAGTDDIAATPRWATPAVEQLFPGVWRVRFGTPERFTPAAVRESSTRVQGFKSDLIVRPLRDGPPRPENSYFQGCGESVLGRRNGLLLRRSGNRVRASKVSSLYRHRLRCHSRLAKFAVGFLLHEPRFMCFARNLDSRFMGLVLIPEPTSKRGCAKT